MIEEKEEGEQRWRGEARGESVEGVVEERGEGRGDIQQRAQCRDKDHIKRKGIRHC